MVFQITSYPSSCLFFLPVISVSALQKKKKRKKKSFSWMDLQLRYFFSQFCKSLRLYRTPSPKEPKTTVFFDRCDRSPFKNIMQSLPLRRAEYSFQAGRPVVLISEQNFEDTCKFLKVHSPSLFRAAVPMSLDLDNFKKKNPVPVFIVANGNELDDLLTFLSLGAHDAHIFITDFFGCGSHTDTFRRFLIFLQINTFLHSENSCRCSGVSLDAFGCIGPSCLKARFGKTPVHDIVKNLPIPLQRHIKSEHLPVVFGEQECNDTLTWLMVTASIFKNTEFVQIPDHTEEKEQKIPMETMGTMGTMGTLGTLGTMGTMGTMKTTHFLATVSMLLNSRHAGNQNQTTSSSSVLCSMIGVGFSPFENIGSADGVTSKHFAATFFLSQPDLSQPGSLVPDKDIGIGIGATLLLLDPKKYNQDFLRSLSASALYAALGLMHEGLLPKSAFEKLFKVTYSKQTEHEDLQSGSSKRPCTRGSSAKSAAGSGGAIRTKITISGATAVALLLAVHAVRHDKGNELGKLYVVCMGKCPKYNLLSRVHFTYDEVQKTLNGNVDPVDKRRFNTAEAQRRMCKEFEKVCNMLMLGPELQNNSIVEKLEPSSVVFPGSSGNFANSPKPGDKVLVLPFLTGAKEPADDLLRRHCMEKELRQVWGFVVNSKGEAFVFDKEASFPTCTSNQDRSEHLKFSNFVLEHFLHKAGSQFAGEMCRVLVFLAQGSCGGNGNAPVSDVSLRSPFSFQPRSALQYILEGLQGITTDTDPLRIFDAAVTNNLLSLALYSMGIKTAETRSWCLIATGEEKDKTDKKDKKDKTENKQLQLVFTHHGPKKSGPVSFKLLRDYHSHVPIKLVYGKGASSKLGEQQTSLLKRIVPLECDPSRSGEYEEFFDAVFREFQGIHQKNLNWIKSHIATLEQRILDVNAGAKSKAVDVMIPKNNGKRPRPE